MRHVNCSKHRPSYELEVLPLTYLVLPFLLKSATVLGRDVYLLLDALLTQCLDSTCCAERTEHRHINQKCFVHVHHHRRFSWLLCWYSDLVALRNWYYTVCRVLSIVKSMTRKGSLVVRVQKNNPLIWRETYPSFSSLWHSFIPAAHLVLTESANSSLRNTCHDLIFYFSCIAFMAVPCGAVPSDVLFYAFQVHESIIFPSCPCFQCRRIQSQCLFSPHLMP